MAEPNQDLVDRVMALSDEQLGMMSQAERDDLAELVRASQTAAAASPTPEIGDGIQGPVQIPVPPTGVEIARMALHEGPEIVGSTAGGIGGAAVAGPGGAATGGAAGGGIGATAGEMIKRVESPKTRGALAGGLSGAGIGAGIGSVVPVVGTGFGAILGGIIGAWGGAEIEHGAEAAEQSRRDEGINEPEAGLYDPSNREEQPDLRDVAQSGAAWGLLSEVGGNAVTSGHKLFRGAMAPKGASTEIATIGGRRFPTDPIPEGPLQIPGAAEGMDTELKILGMDDGVVPPRAETRGFVTRLLTGWTALTDAGTAPMRQMFHRTNIALGRNLTKILKRLGPYDNTPEGRMIVGKKIQEYINSAADANHQPISDGYDAVLSVVDEFSTPWNAYTGRVANTVGEKGLANVPGTKPASLGTKVRDTLGLSKKKGGVTGVLDPKKSQSVELTQDVRGVPVNVGFLNNTLKEFGGLAKLQSLLQDGGNRKAAATFSKYTDEIPDYVTFREARLLMSDLKSVIRSHASDPSRIEALQVGLSGDLTKAMTHAAEEAGLGHVVPQLKQLDQAYRQQIETFYDDAVKALTDSKEPELVAGMIFRKGRDTRAQKAYKALKDEPGAWNVVRRTAFEDVAERARNSPNPEAVRVNWWRGMTTYQQKLLTVDAEHLAHVNAYHNVVAAIMPSKNVEKLDDLGMDFINRNRLFNMGTTAAGAGLGYAGGAALGGDSVGQGTAVLGMITAFASPRVSGAILASKWGSRMLTDATKDLVEITGRKITASDLVRYGIKVREINRKVNSQAAIKSVPSLMEEGELQGATDVL